MPIKSYMFVREGQLAIDRAKRMPGQYGHESVDSLMLLLALLQMPNSRVGLVLNALRVKVENLASRIVATLNLEAQRDLPYSKTNQSDIPLTDECETLLGVSLAEAQLSGYNAIDDLALLLGMVQSSNSKAGQIIAQYAVTVEEVRQQINIVRSMPTSKSSMIPMPQILIRGMRNGISPIFISLLLFTIVMAGFLWFDIGSNPRVFMIAFIMGGWIISVALHEFGHAITAFWGGDESVEQKGYLTLNPLKYSNPFLSIILPVLMLLMGGIGFPGGAVYINIYALRKPSYRSLVSAAGPFASFICFLLLALPFDNIPFLFFSSVPERFLEGIGFLAFLQLTAIMINLLPLPGLDGFGILEPFLPRELVSFTNFIRPFGFIILYLLVFIDSPISSLFWNSVWNIIESISPNLAYYANEGLKIFLLQ